MIWSALLLSLLGFLVVIGRPQEGTDKAKDIVPQGRPVFSLLQAVKDGDQRRLKNVFSERMRKRFDEEGWDKVLKTYQKLFEKEFGDYRLADFAFVYAGGAEEGKVAVVHRGKKMPGLRVIREENAWKIDER